MSKGFRPVMQFRMTVEDEKLIAVLSKQLGLNKTALLRLALRRLRDRGL